MSKGKSRAWEKHQDPQKESVKEKNNIPCSISTDTFSPPFLSIADNQENNFDSPKKLQGKRKKGVSPSSSSSRSPLSERQQIALLLQLTAVQDHLPPEVRTKEKLNERGETPLHLASIRGDYNRVKELLEQGLQVNARDFAGWTPLHEACNHGWFQVAELLIQAGADVNAPGFDNISPLHDAALNGHIKIVRLLLEHGANPRQTNNHHQTALDLTKSKAIAKLLKELKGEDGTMKKNAPATPKSKGSDKGVSSSRLTIKLSQVKPSDSSSQGYTVSVEGGGSSDVYEFSKDEDPANSEVTSNKSNNSNDGGGDSEEPRSTKRRKSTDKAPPVLTPAVTTTSQKSKSPASTPSKQQRSGGSETDSEADAPHSPKVPPLKIVLPPSSSSGLEVEPKERTLPYIVHSSDTTPTSTSCTLPAPELDQSEPEKNEKSTPPPPPITTQATSTTVSTTSTTTSTPSKSKEGSPEERFQRMTRSAHRAAAAQASSSSSSSAEPAPSTSSTHKTSDHAANETTSSTDEGPAPDLHPRKRKLRPRGEANSSSEPPPPPTASTSEEPLQVFNSYQMFQNIRKQVAKKRESMFIVHPKPPQNFKDYLLNRCSYALEGNAASKMNVPLIPPPASLAPPMKDMFVAQENERYKLRRQHLVEREKLILTREQEILRVHARAARASMNQPVPLSVCSVIKDSEIYNVLESPPSEQAASQEDKANRSRYNGRLFLSWMHDVNDKWDKIKEAMLLRHHNEAESLYAVQKLDWEWKLKECGLCDFKSSPLIDEIQVPMVHVSNDFELLPP